MISSGEIPVFTFVNGERSGEQFAISDDAGSLIGRSPEADLVLRDDSVSRKHTRVYVNNGSLWLRDLGSRNGTRVNGAQVARYRLSGGDRVSIGSSLFRLTWVDRSELRLPDQEDSKGRAMTGSLEDIPLTDVLQWLATSRKTGMLRVKGSREGKLTLVNGLVCGATLEGLGVKSPERALLHMMGWDRGMFELSSADEVQEQDSDDPISLEHILMESARIQDETQKLAENSPLPTQGVFFRFSADKPWRDQKAEVIEILQEIARAHAESLTWDDLLCVTELDPLVITQRVIEVRKQGLLGFVGVDEDEEAST